MFSNDVFTMFFMIFEMMVYDFDFLLILQTCFLAFLLVTFFVSAKKIKIKPGKIIRKNIKNIAKTCKNIRKNTKKKNRKIRRRILQFFDIFLNFLMNKQLLFEKSKNQKFYVNAVFHDGFMFFEMLL